MREPNISAAVSEALIGFGDPIPSPFLQRPPSSGTRCYLRRPGLSSKIRARCVDFFLRWHVAGVAAARAAERERIARELHDTLLQGTQGMILVFQSFAGRLARTDPARAEMEHALAYADKLLAEARDRVRQLRDGERHDSMRDVVASLGAEMTQGSATRFNALIIGRQRPLVSGITGDFYRIVREALSNAVRHARAGRIDAQIVYDADRLMLRIRDDGVGIDPEVLRVGSRSGHYGVPGMRERAQNIGATFTIARRWEGGTDVEITLPAERAYSLS